jgi:hypothetical protein
MFLSGAQKGRQARPAPPHREAKREVRRLNGR